MKAQNIEAQRAIDLPIASLPPIDEHAVEIEAGADRTWEALVATLPRVFDTGASARAAAALGCSHTEAKGEPSVIGSTLPGFIVSRSIRPASLALLGQHRFSRYALVFRIDELDARRSRLRAETRADFPGRRGRAYRGLVIGTRGHVLVVRRILRSVRRRAEASPARVDRAKLRDWIDLYVRLWRIEGTDRLDELFAPDASYSTGPYEKPHVGLDAISRMWEAERQGHDELFEIESEVIAVEGDIGVARIGVHYGEPRDQDYRDLWIVRFDASGRCVHFEEWPFWPPGSKGATAASPEG